MPHYVVLMRPNDNNASFRRVVKASNMRVGVNKALLLFQQATRDELFPKGRPGERASQEYALHISVRRAAKEEVEQG